MSDVNLALHGTGDHGGGPRDQDIKTLERMRSIPGALRMSVIRHARDMDPTMSLGTHELVMDLSPAPGDLSESRALRAAARLTRPAISRWENEHPGGLEPWGEIDTSRVIDPDTSFLGIEPSTVGLCASKMPEEHYTPDALVIRVRETQGTDTECKVSLPLPCTEAWLCDHLERPQELLFGEMGLSLRVALRAREIATVMAYI